MSSVQTAHLAAPAETVFGYLYSVEWFPHWYPDLTGAVLVGGEGVGRVHRIRAASGAIEQQMDYRIVVCQAPTSLVWALENGRWSKKGKEQWTPTPATNLCFAASVVPHAAGSTVTLGFTSDPIDVSTGNPLNDLLARPVVSWAAGRFYDKTAKEALANITRIVGG